MSIHPALRVALKALSYPDVDVKKTYKLQRFVDHVKSGRYRMTQIQFRNLMIPAGDHTIPVRLFFPSAEQLLRKGPTIVYFHGGGWVTGDIDSYNRVCATLSKTTGLPVLSVDYRLAPEYRFPDGLEDCYAVVRSLLIDGLPLSISAQDLILMGDSAGGNLAAVVSLMARDRGEFQIHRQVLIYPATFNDHTENSPFVSVKENGTDYLLTSKRICDYMELYVRSPQDYQSPYFAPLLAEDLTNQPTTLILTAEFDPLRDEGEAYGKRLAEAGNAVQVIRIADTLHGFFSLPIHHERVQYCHDLIVRFLQEGIIT